MKLLSVNLQVYLETKAVQAVGFRHCCQQTAEGFYALTYQRNFRQIWTGAAKS